MLSEVYSPTNQRPWLTGKKLRSEKDEISFPTPSFSLSCYSVYEDSREARRHMRRWTHEENRQIDTYTINARECILERETYLLVCALYTRTRTSTVKCKYKRTHKQMCMKQMFIYLFIHKYSLSNKFIHSLFCIVRDNQMLDWKILF